MVSTRRGAQTGPADDMKPATDQTLSLRKKPVRKATAAKTAAAKTETEGPKTRAGRPKKAAEAMEEQKEETMIAAETAKAKPTRSTRATGTRAKQQPKADEPDAKPTRRPTTRKTKVDVQPDVPVLEPNAPATRATRATRATAGKALSPKKVTQVSRAQTRATRTQDEKSKVPKDAPPKRTTQTRSKRRAVSNENEGVEANTAAVREKASEEDAADEETIAPSSPLRHEEVIHESEDEAQNAESEPPMSSRPTTPGGSPSPSFKGTDNEHETQPNTPSAAESEAEGEAEYGSEDELCGPKTPMKRSSPGAERRYLSSVQKTVRRIESESRMETPGLSPNVRVRRGPTPQTQKPYARPQLPGSAARSMTVARGSDRAFVFRPLRKASADQSQLPAMEEEDSVASIGSPLARRYEAEIVASSPLPSEPEAHFDADDTEDEIEEAPVYHDRSLTDSEAPVEHDIAFAPDSDIDETTLHGMDAGHASDEMDQIHDVDENVDATDVASVEIESDHTVVRQEADSDETVVIDDGVEDDDDVDESLLSESQHQNDADIDGSVIQNGNFEQPSVLFDIGPIEQSAHGQEDSFAISDTEDEPQTIDWQNLREDVTIPVNFDWHLTGVGQQHMQREIEQDEEIDPSTGFLKDRTSRASLIMEPNAAEDAFDELEATLNLSEFVDVGALAEPTTRLSVPGPIGVEDPDSEDAVDISMSSHNSGSAADTGSGTKTVEAPVEYDSLPEDLDDGVNAQTAAGQSTPAALSREASEIDISLSTPEPAHEAPTQADTPHYALPTISFDARRKSLPAFLHRTPVYSSGARPNTSDGASIPRLANPFVQAWYHGARQTSLASTPLASPSGRRPSTAYGGLGSTGRKSSFAGTLRGAEKGAASSVRRALQAELPMTQDASPSRTTGERYPISVKAGRKSSVAVTPKSASKTARGSLSQRKQTPSPASTATPTPAEPTPSKTPGERYPKSAKRGAMYGGEYPEENSAQLGGTPATVSKTQATPQATPRERYPRSAKQSRPSLGLPKATPSTARKSTSSPQKPSPAKPEPNTAQPVSPAKATTPPDPSPVPSPAQSTPQSERFPRMNRRTYGIPNPQHATTIAAPSRFRTPTKSPLKPPGPSTAQKPSSLRKLALTRPTQTTATPQKTPLKPAGAETPGALAVPMTPHPSAPLRGVLALVEIFTLEGASASTPFVALLQRLGARTTRVWKEGVTHVVFKDGSPTTLQRVRLHNKDAVDGRGAIHCVNSRWVSDCDAEGKHVDERDEAYAVDISEVPRGGKRRRKSMEPSALVNLNGNVVGAGAGGRKASLGRSSLGRSPTKLAAESPVKVTGEESDATPKAQASAEGDKENWGAGEDSPVTPDWIGAPEKLVQQTAPIDRVRKLEVKGGQGGNRRLTFWKGA